MKVLTVITVFFAPLTVLTSLYGMNVSLPHLPGGEQNQFWWIVGMMAVLVGGMLWFMRSRRWL
jgi:LPXTG-motif cell wall-anchored protein